MFSTSFWNSSGNRVFFIQYNVWSVLCTFFNAQMAEIPCNKQVIHPFTFINSSLRQKYIIKRPYKHILCDIPSLFGFQHFHHKYSSKTETFTVNTGQVCYSSFGGGQVQTSFNKIRKAVNNVNELPLYVKKPILIKPWLFIPYLKDSLLLCTWQ